MMKKVLIANRGEIAVRIHRACKELGLKTVAVHSKADQDSMHVMLADESVCIGPAAAKDSYLNIAAILTAAMITGADAIHPGYGFLSENASFVDMVCEHDITFIGPTAEHIRVMGDKITAIQTVKKHGIPTVPGSDGEVKDTQHACEIGDKIGYPVLIKAAGGGGGKGMKVAYNQKELCHLFPIAKNEAAQNFGNNIVYIEKFLEKPRHIEIQVMADQHGNVVHLGERDCSLQRHNQKVLEECPSPAISTEIRDKIGMIVANAMKKIGYHSIGTIEFLYENGEFYFIEMNTRLQVEHPVTEMVYNIDLVKEQIKIAMGEKLSHKQKDIIASGHAIECRVNAEDPFTFMPCPGQIKLYHPPGGLGVRVDSHLYTGYKIPPYYDSMIGKLIIWAQSREECLKRLDNALSEYVITDTKTNLLLHKKLIDNHDIQKGQYDIHWLEKFVKNISQDIEDDVSEAL